MQFLPQHYKPCHCKQEPRDQQYKIIVVQKDLLTIGVKYTAGIICGSARVKLFYLEAAPRQPFPLQIRTRAAKPPHEPADRLSFLCRGLPFR